MCAQLFSVKILRMNGLLSPAQTVIRSDAKVVSEI